MAPEPILTVEDVHTYYGESYVLQGVSLTVPEGQVVALLGRNGMGKTTLIRSVAGLTPPRRGVVTFRGQPIQGLPPYQIARLGIGLVPQGRRIFGSLSVLENLTVPTSSLAGGRRRNGSAGGWTRERVLEQFPQLRARLHNRGRSLSGGEQSMLAIARALMANPELLLMDEPSEGLAPVIVAEIRDIMLNLKREGLSILLVEQRFDLAMAVADKVYIIANGQIVYKGTPQDLERQEAIRSQHLGI